MNTRWIGGAVILAVVGVGAYALIAGSAPEVPPEPRAPVPGDLPPPLHAGGRALQVIANHYDVGLVICPIDTDGIVARVHGTPRDALRSLGPVYLLDIDPTVDAPWDPIYDVAFAQDGWAVLLAAPGSTGGMVRPYGRTLQLTWPPAQAGELVACTAIESFPSRTIRGTLQGDADPRYSALVGCGPPIQPDRDGQFSFRAEVPCTLWAESRGFRSAEMHIDGIRADADGQAPDLDDLILEFEADTRFTVSGVSPEGRDQLLNALRAESKRIHLHLTALDGLLSQFEAEPKVHRQLGRWATVQTEWARKVDGVIWSLENTPPHDSPPE